MIDAHIHLEQYDDVDEKMIHWRKNGIEKVVAVSTDLASAYRTLELKEKYPKFVVAAIGFHPEQLPPSDGEFLELVKLIEVEKQRLSAIGEVGLPYYTRDKLSESQYGKHKELFREWCQLGEKIGLPLAVHAVHSEADVALAIVKESNVRAHFHWLKASLTTIDEIVKEGHMISFTPDICERVRDQRLAQAIPLENILIETDGPWQFEGFASRETTSLLLEEVVKTLARVKEVSIQSVVQQTVGNTKRFYGIE